MKGRTPNIFVVGSGPVGGALAGAFRRAGLPVLGLFGRRPEAARRAGAIAGVAAYSAAPPDLLLDSDVVVLAVRDEAIGEVAETLVGTGLITRKHVLLACSGALSSHETLGSVKDRVGGVGTLHPLRSIPDARQGMAELPDTLFGVEGDEVGRETANLLVRQLGARAISLDGGQMALYHAAASVASNFLCALLDGAATILERAGVSREEALPALLPLARGTLENVARAGLPDALTGPIARGDVQTVERHLAALGEAGPELLALYRLLARHTVALARRKGSASFENLERIDESLARGEQDH